MFQTTNQMSVLSFNHGTSANQMLFASLSPGGSNAHSARKWTFRTTHKNSMTNLRPQPPSKIGSTHASNWLQQMNHSPLPNSAWSSQYPPGLLHLRECTSRSSAWHPRRRNPPGEAVSWQFTPIMSQLCKCHPLNGPLQAIEMGKVKFFTNQWRVPNIFSYPICPSPSSRHMHRGHFQVHPPKAIVRQRGVGHQAVHQIHRAFLTCGWLRVPYVPWWVPGRAGSDLKKNAGGSWAKWWVFTCSNGDLSIYQQRLSNIEACGDLNN